MKAKRSRFRLFVFALLTLATASLPALRYVAPHDWPVVEVAGARTAEFEGGVIRYERAGTEGADAVVLLHGFNSQLSVWNAVWAHLGDCPDRVRLDLPGFGGSKWQAESFALPAQAARVLALLDRLKISRATFAGTSMGGSLAAWIAAHHPERVKSLVLMAPSGFPGSLRYAGLYGELLKPGPVKTAATWLAGSTFYRQLFPGSIALQALTVTASYGEPWAGALTKIRAPTILLWSRGDTTVLFEYAQSVTSAIAGATLVPLPEAVGHDIPHRAAEKAALTICKMHRGAPHG